uniref:Secreted protein n=1 Tax=Arundo donax TaxID=35708 RepID=A0A0A9E4M7_ARUDO
MPRCISPACSLPIAILPLCSSYSVLDTSNWRAPSLSMRGSGMHLRIASKRGPRSSAKLSGDSPAFPLIPLA